MQQHSLLQTKLYIPPIRPELVPRPRPLKRLNEGLACKLAVISAPAGFGKTTLLCERISKLSEVETADRIAWLLLDEDDNDPARFLVYVVAALKTIEADTGDAELLT